MTTTVLRRPRATSAATTSASDCSSRAAVGSSSSRHAGSFTNARANATRALCPPESKLPPTPTSVSYPCGRAQMKLCAEAAVAAASTCT
mmetsp:Transcript_7126/g.15586  ORF Transcript_7126/g.15586 Transcript_7126/m.15586 type:complete len:89 (-) Transcript_7126:1601-1867(-)